MEIPLVSSGFPHTTIPQSYIRPEPDLPKLSEAKDYYNAPVIDFGCGDTKLIANQIAQACQQNGCFQVINHGVSKELMEKMVQVTREFFDLPVEEKMKLYSNDPCKTTRLSTSSNFLKEKVHNWRDYLRLHCYPLDNYVKEWPNNPPSFNREAAAGEPLPLREIGRVLTPRGGGEENSDLRTGREYIYEKFAGAHTDPNTLTILLQDAEVMGHQLLKDGKWMTVKPIPNAFVVNIGDQLQALSNSRYKSTWHRAVVNAHKARISVASFLCPSNSAVIKAPKELTENGSEYYDKFWGRNLDQGHCLELFKNVI
ncbi:2-oxoglutarate (2OG) and Fe(II)-dependent oxygenase superfamily protein [Striga hermonthica]|uniref:2-oxoglutarate (2OG) and Fe(II)-dependent oxygenase superfamily protein n=1 Tax=Striga hermonthica TaxID=68872 RepID=A0A9N7MPT9_STRHE|nr:2-oxoglutarate (2OG) and Fe(II)-dependent oxygenase superfamily protein [Striga hermonthica]